MQKVEGCFIDKEGNISDIDMLTEMLGDDWDKKHVIANPSARANCLRVLSRLGKTVEEVQIHFPGFMA